MHKKAPFCTDACNTPVYYTPVSVHPTCTGPEMANLGTPFWHPKMDFWGPSWSPSGYRPSKWHYRQRKIIFELIMHFIADTDTDENYLELIFRSRCRHSCSLQFWGGRIADRNCFGIIFYFITDTDTEKYYFRIISAMNSDKRYLIPKDLLRRGGIKYPRRVI